MIETILVLLIAGGSLYQLFSLFCIVSFFGPGITAQEEDTALPAVSLLKPLCGTDPELEKNIRSFCDQDYPEYEVLLGFTDPDDSGLPVAREHAHSPECMLRVVVSSGTLGTNRKVSNLQGLAEAARYPLLAISDSDMRAERTYLRRIIEEYRAGRRRGSNVGLVTSLYKISDPRTPGAALESLTLALDFIPAVLAVERMEGVTFGLGASMLLSKQALEEVGGFPAIANHLADDYQIGNRLSKKGYAVVLSKYVLEDIAGPMRIDDHVTHQLRWARTYRACRPKGYWGYGVTYIVPLALLLLAVEGPTPRALLLFGGTLALRLLTAFAVYRRIIRAQRWLRWLPLIPLKDILSFGIWFRSLWGNTVRWRGATFRVVKDGLIEPLPERR